MKKKKGIINEIVYLNTAYYNGKYRFYPTVTGLKLIIKEIISAKATTKYIRFIPFYRNGKIHRQIEFDEYMFFLQCREQFNEKEWAEHIGQHFDKSFEDLTDEEKRIGKILMPLCKFTDTDSYQRILETYVEFLNELIPFLMNIAKSEMRLTEDDIAFGYFCFEIHSD